MLSYQHIYHAGNLADVHKHSMLAWALSYMTRKDKPLSYMESHAGRGLYDLTDAEAIKTGEAAQGIARAATWFSPDHPYSQVRARIQAKHGKTAYPGSPVVAAECLRPMDNLYLSELHPQEFTALQTNMAPYGGVFKKMDGLEMALSMCPPDPRRGILLIDPSFEVKTDYQTIPKTITQVHRKWGVGVPAGQAMLAAARKYKRVVQVNCPCIRRKKIISPFEKLAKNPIQIEIGGGGKARLTLEKMRQLGAADATYPL